MEMKKIGGTDCYILKNGEAPVKRPLPVFLWASFVHEGSDPSEMLQKMIELLGDQSYGILLFMVKDWNKEMSPWEAPPVFGREAFLGGGPDTLKWMNKELISFVKDFYGENIKLYPVGYSMGGLFSLWALYESSGFSGAVSCSGSLWFPGWPEYIKKNCLKNPSKVYLSLGDKEEKTRNKTMRMVGDHTRHQHDCLSKDPNVVDVILEWNPGGHFADSLGRLAKGLRWILES